MLSAAQRESWRDQGYLVLPGFKSAAEIDVLRERARQIVEACQPAERPSVFSTRDWLCTVDPQFLASAAGVHCFFEEEAFGAGTGTLVCLHGLLPHTSAANRSAMSRQAYSLHITDGRADYSPLNWLQRGPDLPVRGLA